MKKMMLLIQLLTVLLSFGACSKSKSVEPVKEDETPVETTHFRVIGYLFARGRLAAEMNKLDYSKITHLNVAFINPDADGVFRPADDLAAAVKKAHDNKVKILFSFGGGNPPAHLMQMLQPDKRAAFVQGLVKVMTDYGFDGVDVDLEGDYIDSNYEAIVTELSTVLKPMKKLLTVAVVTWTSPKISNKALGLFDFINIMSYDHTGPWDKTRPGQHSSYTDAQADIQHWNVTRGVAAAKLNLGVPFYGYGFGKDIAESMSYKDLVVNFPGAENKDEVVLDGGTLFYNGLPTMRKKVTLAHDKKLGGIMIWELTQDAPAPYSLLDAINNVKP